MTARFRRTLPLFALPGVLFPVPGWAAPEQSFFDLMGRLPLPMEILVVLTFLSFIPAVIVMFTSFTRIVVVISFLRQAVGTPQVPPNPVVIGLALFLTYFVMAPTLDTINREAVKPYLGEEIPFGQAVERAETPLKGFMLRQVREKDLALFLRIAREERPGSPEDLSMKVVIPAFAIGELRRAFEIGFLIYIPFLVIDMIVSSVLLSMGMMMLPPVMISLPFKLLLFVMVDGWNLLVGSLVGGFA